MMKFRTPTEHSVGVFRNMHFDILMRSGLFY